MVARLGGGFRGQCKRDTWRSTENARPRVTARAYTDVFAQRQRVPELQYNAMLFRASGRGGPR
eukprot:8273535-Lingulodinium_polyedra.AAC.1